MRTTIVWHSQEWLDRYGSFPPDIYMEKGQTKLKCLVIVRHKGKLKLKTDTYDEYLSEWEKHDGGYSKGKVIYWAPWPDIPEDLK